MRAAVCQTSPTVSGARHAAQTPQHCVQIWRAGKPQHTWWISSLFVTYHEWSYSCHLLSISEAILHSSATNLHFSGNRATWYQCLYCFEYQCLLVCLILKSSCRGSFLKTILRIFFLLDLVSPLNQCPLNLRSQLLRFFMLLFFVFLYLFSFAASIWLLFLFKTWFCFVADVCPFVNYSFKSVVFNCLPCSSWIFFLLACYLDLYVVFISLALFGRWYVWMNIDRYMKIIKKWW